MDINSIFPIVIAAAIIGFIILGFVMGASKGGSKRGRGGKSVDKVAIQHKWSEIESIMNSGNAIHLTSAVMDADKVFDLALKGITGKDGSFADRLKAAEKRFSSYNIYQDIWEAHKLRNRIAHEVHAEIPALQSREALERFRKGLRDLRVL